MVLATLSSTDATSSDDTSSWAPYFHMGTHHIGEMIYTCGPRDIARSNGLHPRENPQGIRLISLSSCAVDKVSRVAILLGIKIEVMHMIGRIASSHMRRTPQPCRGRDVLAALPHALSKVM